MEMDIYQKWQGCEQIYSSAAYVELQTCKLKSVRS